MLVLLTMNFIMQGIVFFSKFLCGSLLLAEHPSSVRSLPEVFEFQEVDHSTLSLGVFCHVYSVV